MSRYKIIWIMELNCRLYSRFCGVGKLGISGIWLCWMVLRISLAFWLVGGMMWILQVVFRPLRESLKRVAYSLLVLSLMALLEIGYG